MKNIIQYLEIEKLKEISVISKYGLCDLIFLYSEYLASDEITNGVMIILADTYLEKKFFLLENYGKTRAIERLKKLVISESGMDDVIELAEQMRSFLRRSGLGLYTAKQAEEALLKLGRL